MQDKPMLVLTIILLALIGTYFWIYGFSMNKWTRYGQYGGIGMGIFFLVDNLFRPGK
jgi:hypothetical protein